MFYVLISSIGLYIFYFLAKKYLNKRKVIIKVVSTELI